MHLEFCPQSELINCMKLYESTFQLHRTHILMHCYSFIIIQKNHEMLKCHIKN